MVRLISLRRRPRRQPARPLTRSVHAAAAHRGSPTRTLARSLSALTALAGLVVVLGPATAAQAAPQTTCRVNLGHHITYDACTGWITAAPAGRRSDGTLVQRYAMLFDSAEKDGGAYHAGPVQLPTMGGSVFLGVVTACGVGQVDVRTTPRPVKPSSHLAGAKFRSPAGDCQAVTPQPKPTPTVDRPRRPSPTPTSTPARPAPKSPPATSAQLSTLPYTGPGDGNGPLGLTGLALVLLGTVLRVGSGLRVVSGR